MFQAKNHKPAPHPHGDKPLEKEELQSGPISQPADRHRGKARDRLKIAVLCDPHFSEEPPNLPAEIFAELSKKADILLLGGDITDQGSVAEAKIATEALSACNIPVLAVLGNHDFESGQDNQVRETLQSAGVHFLDHHPYILNGVGFVGTKGFGGGFGPYLLAPFGEPVIKKFVAEATEEAYKLENQLKSLSTPKKAVLLHYAPIVETTRGEPPEITPFLGCSRLAETIDRYDIDMVFHGHVHRGAFHGQTMRGIPVYNCCSQLLLRQKHHQPYAIFEL